MEGNVFSTVDQFGMAQKGRAVTSHIRLAESEDDITAVKLNLGAADLVLGCDSLVTGGEVAGGDVAGTQVIVNSHGRYGSFCATRSEISDRRTRRPDGGAPVVTALTGSTQRSWHTPSWRFNRNNLFMLGYAYQRGLIPVSWRHLESGELNGVAIDMNKSAFAGTACGIG